MPDPRLNPTDFAWNFETAVTAWRSAAEGRNEESPVPGMPADHDDEVEFAIAEAAEVYILDRTPGSVGEAAAILDIVVAAADSRVDGRDRDALRRVRDFIVTLEMPPATDTTPG